MNANYSCKPQGYYLGDCRTCKARCVAVSKRRKVCRNCKKAKA